MSRTDHRFLVAVDIGQANDYTALVILHAFDEYEELEPDQWTAPKAQRRYELVHIERFRDLSYPEQVKRIAERYRELEAHAGTFYGKEPTVDLVVDATGVGKPILDLLRDAHMRARGVIITGGDTVTSGDGMDRVPKRELVTSLQVALQSGLLKIASDLPLAPLLEKELLGFRVKITLTGHAKFGNDVGAWREADHDDLVLATALGVWSLKYRSRMSLAVLRKIAGLI